MNLKEFQGKKIFYKFNISIPLSFLVNKKKHQSVNPFIKLKSPEVVLKAQIPFGKRGKNGGVLFADKNDFNQKLKLLFSKKINNFNVKEILVEEKLKIKKELYLAVTIDRLNKGLIIIFSLLGGIDIEETAKIHPDQIIKIPSGQKENLSKIPKNILSVGQKLVKLCQEENALLAEINPLILTTDNHLIAADSKIVIDDNSIKKTVNGLDFSFVKLDGNIGVIGNGAGLVMATLDTLVYFGGKPANFLDIGGGANKEKMIKAIETVLEKKGVKAMLINIFGGITRCDQIAQGIVDYYKGRGIKIPFVVRLVGTNEKQGQKILKQAGINFSSQMNQAIKKIIKLVK